MGLSKKRKQHLAQITVHAAETKKHRKTDQENQRRRRFLRKQREEEDFWDQHADFRSESSSDESNFVESSLDGCSSDEEDLDVREDGRGDSIQEGLGDNDEEVQLKVKDHSIQPVCKDDAGEYLRGIRGCGSSATEKRERRRKRDMEKSASTTRSIVDIFSAQLNKNQSRDECILSASLPTISSPKSTGKEVRETRFESQTRAVHDLGELLRLKTIQMDR